ncbi:MAG: site-specific integrase [Deltaproteobacteria bacterium]|nr:site-specific integrase [Deltaproteobacteria bacterium]
MFNVLIKSGKAGMNPVSLVTFFGEIQKERVLSVAEVEKILQEIEKADVRYHHLKDILVLGLNTAMRMGEILSMKRSWVDLKEGIITVPRASQKRKTKDKRVPINSVVKRVLKRLMDQKTGSEYVVVNLKTGTRFTAIQNSWNGILKKAGLGGVPGVDKLRLHDLRHTAATNLALAGKDIKFIAQYLGHSDVRTTARYIHYSDEDLKDGSEILAGFSSEVPSKVPTVKLKAIQGGLSS